MTTKRFGPKGWTPEQLGSLTGKTYVITGANAGAGFEATRVFLSKGASVVMTNRNADKSNAAIATLKQEFGGDADVSFVRMDLAVLDSVRDAAAEVLEKVSHIDALICNAAIAQVARQEITVDGFESQLGVNHFGHFLLCGSLFERIEGGDFVWFDEGTCAVGLTYRTNAEGIRQLREILGQGVEVIETALPHYKGPGDVFHLMSILSPLDRDLALVYSPLMPIPFRDWLVDRGVALVEVPDEEFETMGCNVLALGPRRCLVVEGNPETRRRLEAAGCLVESYEGLEISIKGGGGPTCLTRPLARE